MAERQGDGADGRPGPAGGAGLSRTWTWAAVATVALGFGAFVFEPVWQPRLFPPLSAEALAAQGATVYREHCALCHGSQAQGQVPSQPNGGQRADGTYIAPALDGTAHAWHHPPQQLFQLVKQGSPAPDSPMRGFAERLSDRQIEAVLAYIQSLWPAALRERYRGLHSQS